MQLGAFKKLELKETGILSKIKKSIKRFKQKIKAHLQ